MIKRDTANSSFVLAALNVRAAFAPPGAPLETSASELLSTTLFLLPLEFLSLSASGECFEDDAAPCAEDVAVSDSNDEDKCDGDIFPLPWRGDLEEAGTFETAACCVCSVEVAAVDVPPEVNESDVDDSDVDRDGTSEAEEPSAEEPLEIG